MAVNAPGRYLRLTISDPDGNNAEDWTNALKRADLEGGSFDESGLDIKRGTLTLLSVRGNPSIDVRENRSSFRPGRKVVLEYLGDDRITWKPLWLGTQYIKVEPSPLSQEYNQIPELTLELSGALDYYGNEDEPDSDESGVTLGGGVNSGVVTSNLLQAGQIPAGIIGFDTSSFPYTIQAPVVKERGSFVAEAGEVAEANHRILYEDTAGNVQAKELDVAPTAAALVVTVGTDAIESFPQQLDGEPPDKTVAYGVNEGSSTTQNPFTTCSEFIGNLATVDSFLGGTGAIERVCTTQSYSFNSANPSAGATETIVQEVLRLSVLISPLLSPKGQRITAEETTTTKYYDSNLRLYQETVVIRMPSVSIAPNVFNEDTAGETLQRIAIEREINYDFDDEGTIQKIWTKERRAKAMINSGENDDPYTLVDYEQKFQSWHEGRPGRWSYSESRSKALFLVNPDAAESIFESAFLYDMTAAPPGSTPPSYSPAPRAEEFELPDGATEEPLMGEATFEHPGGPLNRERLREFEITPAFSVSQLSRIAQEYGALYWGRNQGSIIELPLTDAILDGITEPLQPVQVVTEKPGEVVTTTFLVDNYTLSFQHDSRSRTFASEAAFAGIWVREESTAAPTTLPYISFTTATTTGTTEAAFVASGASATNTQQLIGEIPESIDTTGAVLLGTVTVV